ncbi:MAG: CDP-alcohol phosphatidyltransferase family protein [Planctomycetota bacterium]|jgi:CDP-diacylglycerol--glycerol-3-phosphate 3-phosphatidyltransferase
MTVNDSTPLPEAGDSQSAEHDVHGLMTVPNALTLLRLLGSAPLIWLAQAGHGSWFVALFVTLLATDWLDGKLALLLHQRSVLGAQLDSAADLVMHACLVLGVALLRPDFIRSDALLIGAMVGSYALSLLVALARFHRTPAYHTWTAKTAWWLAAIGALTLLLGGPAWPVRLALAAVILANGEAVAISFVIPRWEADIRSLRRALRRRKE